MNTSSTTTTPEDLIASAASAAAKSRDHHEARDFKVPVRACEPWCAVGGGHADEMPGDRNCWSDGRSVPLSLEEPFEALDDEWVMPIADVSLRRGRLSADSRVVLMNTAGSGEIVMTLHEGERHARNILAEVAAARG
jgi:hypothetical protein